MLPAGGRPALLGPQCGRRLAANGTRPAAPLGTRPAPEPLLRGPSPQGATDAARAAADIVLTSPGLSTVGRLQGGGCRAVRHSCRQARPCPALPSAGA
jgi:hypothetical protein